MKHGSKYSIKLIEKASQFYEVMCTRFSKISCYKLFSKKYQLP